MVRLFAFFSAVVALVVGAQVAVAQSASEPSQNDDKHITVDRIVVKIKDLLAKNLDKDELKPRSQLPPALRNSRYDLVVNCIAIQKSAVQEFSRGLFGEDWSDRLKVKVAKELADKINNTSVIRAITGEVTPASIIDVANKYIDDIRVLTLSVDIEKEFDHKYVPIAETQPLITFSHNKEDDRQPKARNSGEYLWSVKQQCNDGPLQPRGFAAADNFQLTFTISAVISSRLNKAAALVSGSILDLLRPGLKNILAELVSFSLKDSTTDSLDPPIKIDEQHDGLTLASINGENLIYKDARAYAVAEQRNEPPSIKRKKQVVRRKVIVCKSREASFFDTFNAVSYQRCCMSCSTPVVR
ncbi:MAG: hypothetical protein ACLPKB_32820 [Xanthobacteraceae bacterium]